MRLFVVSLIYCKLKFDINLIEYCNLYFHSEFFGAAHGFNFLKAFHVSFDGFVSVCFYGACWNFVSIYIVIGWDFVSVYILFPYTQVLFLYRPPRTPDGHRRINKIHIFFLWEGDFIYIKKLERHTCPIATCERCLVTGTKRHSRGVSIHKKSHTYL